MVSMNCMSPIFTPLRRYAACGAMLMLSWPPAITILLSPVRICCAPSATARSPEPQSWLMPNAVLLSGMPASSAALRAGFCPCAAVSTWPRIASSISAPSSLARDRAAWIATVPSTWAGTLPNAPLKLPTGVRAAETMTMSSELEADMAWLTPEVNYLLRAI